MREVSIGERLLYSYCYATSLMLFLVRFWLIIFIIFTARLADVVVGGCTRDWFSDFLECDYVGLDLTNELVGSFLQGGHIPLKDCSLQIGFLC